MKCKCYICRRHRLHKEKIKKVPNELKDYVNGLYDSMCNAENDRDWYEMQLRITLEKNNTENTDN